MAIRIVDFNLLPARTRERFVAITKGRGGPGPLFARKGATGAIVGWSILLVLALMVLVGLTINRFGSEWYGSALQGPEALIGYVVTGFLALLAVTGIVKHVLVARALPFDAGTYVLPMDVVIASSKDLKILAPSDLVGIQPIHHYRNGIYMNTSITFSFVDGTNEVFTVHGQLAAQAALDRFRQAGAQIDDAISRKDMNALAALDPFIDARLADWQPQVEMPDVGGGAYRGPGQVAGSAPQTAPKAKEIPGWTRFGWALALGAAALGGPLLWAGRNVASDHSAYGKYERKVDVALGQKPSADPYGYGSTFDSYMVDDLRRYGEKSWIHGGDVEEKLLPRAELAKAVKDDDPDAIQSVVARYAGKPVEAAAKQALEDSLHRKFEDAKGKNTVAALREFTTKYPSAKDVGAAKNRIHELFQSTLADFKKRAAKDDPDMVPFVERMLDYLEDNASASVQVRFRRHNDASLAIADKLLAKGDQADAILGSGGLASVSGRFDDDAARPREEAMVGALKTGFSQVFPADVLPLTMGTELSGDERTVPAVKAPTIVVDYVVKWSGSEYVDRVGGRRFVGIKIDFDVAMLLPGEPKGLKMALQVRPPSSFTVNYSTMDSSYLSLLGKGGPSDSQVYDVMALRAFDELSTKLQEHFFRSLPKAPPKPVKPKTPSWDDDDDE